LAGSRLFSRRVELALTRERRLKSRLQAKGLPHQNMLSLFVLLTTAARLHAGVVQGVVLEHISGRPLARAIVRLDPVPGSGDGKLRPLTMRSGRSGHFAFASVQAGTWLLTAMNDGYFPTSYGQRIPIGRGRPIEVTLDSQMFAELRLRHKGALTGRVLDENGVGTAGIQVLAYRARLPLRSAGHATSDDRGVFRIAGLEPGKYWVRSAAATLSDGSGWLPTYGPHGREAREARVNPVSVDADASDADVNPEAGNLFHLSGLILCDKDGPVTVTLSSETGRRSVGSACSFPYRFDGLSPGNYEVFARLQDGTSSGFTELFLDRDSDSGNVLLLQLPDVYFEVQRGNSFSPADRTINVIGHRLDLSETEENREIKTPRTALDPGHWELRAQVPHGQYVESIVNMSAQPRRAGNSPTAADWYEVFIQHRFSSRIRIRVSDQAGEIKGKVVTDDKPVPATPVFLWPTAESAHRSLGGPVQALSSVDGKFGFDSLPPGDYRILASFDVNEVDADLMDLSQALTIHVGGRQTAEVELPVWIAP
jgi:hypothetical protein